MSLSLRYLKRVLLILALAAASVIVAGMIYIRTDSFGRLLKSEVSSLLATRIRGEITLLVEVPAKATSSLGASNSARESIAARVARLQAESGVDEKEALKRVARELGQSKSEVYRELQRERARKR